MQYTSAQVGKMLKKLNDDYSTLIKKEDISKEFVVSLGETPDSVRPEYDFCATQKALTGLEEKMRKIRHALNIFNATTVVPQFGITIDEMLVLIPQLSKRKQKLFEMKGKLPKMREHSGYSRVSTVVEYRYLNYAVADVETEYERITEMLGKAQMALDMVNNTATLDIDL